MITSSVNGIINPESGKPPVFRSEIMCDVKGSMDSLPLAGRYFGNSETKSLRIDTIWSSSEYSYNNAWNVNNNGNVNNNNKNNNNNNYGRAVCASASSFSNPYFFNNQELSLFHQSTESYVELNDLFEAYFECRKHKRKTMNAISFEVDYEHNLIELYNEINQGTYRLGRSIAFIVKKPVQREVFAADFRDRVVHHYIIRKINHLFEQLFIENSFSCRKGKGTLHGVKQLHSFIIQCSNHYTTDAYILKLDIEGFFMHIDKVILYNKLKNFLEEQYFGKDKNTIIELCRLIIENNPASNCIIKGSKKDWNGLPKSKSLFTVGATKGMPIGNLTSQIFANFYLDDLDKFITKTLGIKYYGRYVDDFVIVHHNKEYLKSLIPLINSFLKEKLKLNLHSKKIFLQHYSKGVKYIGAVVKENRLYIANRTKGNCWECIQRHNQVINNHYLNRREIEAFQSSINSYLGIMKHYRTYNIRRTMIKKHFSPLWWNHVSVHNEHVVLRNRIIKKKYKNRYFI